jgi:hypothetical protein
MKLTLRKQLLIIAFLLTFFMPVSIGKNVTQYGLDKKETPVDYLNFGAGAALGASIELSINVANACISSITTILQSLYLIFYYMRTYMTTNDDEYIAYSVQYLLKLFRSGVKVQVC